MSANRTTAGIAAGRSERRGVRRQFQRRASAARPARGAGRGRPLLLLLRRALPDRPARPPSTSRSSSARSRPATTSARPRPSSTPTSSAACAPASARPRRCARKPACARHAEGKPVKIGLLQRHATDTLLAAGKQPFERGPATGKRVAVVGGGPAGLSCAHKLAELGHDVTRLRGPRQARRPQRVRHRRLQDDGRLRPARGRTSSSASAASRSRPAARSATASTSPPCGRTSTRCSSAWVSPASTSSASPARARSAASSTRSTTSPGCARRPTSPPCRSAAASS